MHRADYILKVLCSFIAGTERGLKGEGEIIFCECVKIRIRLLFICQLVYVQIDKESTIKISSAKCSILFVESHELNVFIRGTSSRFSTNTCQIINVLPLLFVENFNIM